MGTGNWEVCPAGSPCGLEWEWVPGRASYQFLSSAALGWSDRDSEAASPLARTISLGPGAAMHHGQFTMGSTSWGLRKGLAAVPAQSTCGPLGHAGHEHAVSVP